MLRIRLQRRGKRNYATYRVVVADQRAPIKGKFIDDVGFYNPHTNEFKVDAEQVKKWMENGAQPTATINNLLVENKVIKGEKVTSWRPKIKKGEEADKAETEDQGEKPKEQEVKEAPTKEAPEAAKEEDEKKKVDGKVA